MALPENTATLPVVEEREHNGDGLVHVMPFDNDNIALCGADRTGRPWADDDAETTCEICRALDEAFPPDD